MSMKKLLQTVACAATLSLLASGAQAQGELFLYNWSNYFPPDLLTKFEKDTGIKVTLDVYDSNETMLAKLQAGAAGYDVVVPSDYMVKIMIERSEEPTSELQSLTRISYSVVCLKNKNTTTRHNTN